MPTKSRLQLHQQLSSQIADHSDNALSVLLQNAAPMHEGVGGTSSILKIDEQMVFVKRIALTDLERKTENFLSTANLFDLPLFFQYRLGSAGFGAGRELEAHKLTTEWVISGACTNFPLLYHWRILEGKRPAPMTPRQTEVLNIAVEFWDNSLAVRHRLEALHEASAHLLLFLEYIPETLHQWLLVQLGNDGNCADSAVAKVEKDCNATSAFFSANNFVHFDAHFNNILSNGNLYYSDFGLALSEQFDLEKEEVDFLRHHRSYDRCVSIVSLIQTLMLHFYGEGKWLNHLRAFINSNESRPERMTPFLESKIKAYAPIAFRLSEFYQQLDTETKSVIYPAEALEQTLKEIDDGCN